MLGSAHGMTGWNLLGSMGLVIIRGIDMDRIDMDRIGMDCIDTPSLGQHNLGPPYRPDLLPRW